MFSFSKKTPVALTELTEEQLAQVAGGTSKTNDHDWDDRYHKRHHHRHHHHYWTNDHDADDMKKTVTTTTTTTTIGKVPTPSHW